MKKKILMYIGVIVLTVLIALLFFKLFNFEGDKEEVPEIKDEVVTELYNYLLDKNIFGSLSMYSGNYTTFNNLNPDIVSKIVYEYLLNEQPAYFEITSIDELESNNIISNNADINPLYKIKIELFNDAFKKIFGDDAVFKPVNFKYDYNIEGKINKDMTYYFVYETDDNSLNDDVVYRKMLRYSVGDNNNVIKIYDYYLRCDVNTKICYNDEKKTNKNNNILYSNNLNIDNYSNVLKTYEHTFVYSNGNYYWKSSQMI